MAPHPLNIAISLLDKSARKSDFTGDSVASFSRAQRLSVAAVAALALSMVSIVPAGATVGAADAVEFFDHNGWFVTGASPATAGAAACGSRDVARLTVVVAGHGGSTAPGPAACVNATHAFFPAEPGWYAGRAVATFGDGSTMCDAGWIHLGILPRDPASVNGFPPLERVPAARTALSAALELVVAPDGNVRDYSVSSGSDMLLEASGNTVPSPDDRVVIVELRATSAYISVDGVVLWQGATLQTGAEWWHRDPAMRAPLTGLQACLTS